MAELKTFQAWAAEGRAVMKGEVAEFYRVSPDGRQSRAVFSEDQTEPVSLIDQIWTEIVRADERPVPKKQSTGLGGSKIKVQQEDGEARIWVGPNKEAIKVLQANGFRFDHYTRRWHARREGDKFGAMIRGLREWGFEVEDEREVVL